MTKVAEKSAPLIQNSNLKNIKAFRGGTSKLPEGIQKLGSEFPKAEITEKARVLNAAEEARVEMPADPVANQSSSKDLAGKAASVAKALSKIPVLPIIVPAVESKALSKNSDKKVTDKKLEPPIHYIKKPAIIFIEGFSAFGISNGDGIKDMAENFPGAKKFNWSEHEKIVSEIKKHAPDEPVVLVGHSFGGDTAIEVAHELNSPKNMFRPIDLIISIDAVGMNKTVIPVNVKGNLNYFGEGLLPFLHGDPTVARNTKYTTVTNELRSDMHSKMDDNPEVQFEIFNKINQVIENTNDDDIIIEISEVSQLKDILEMVKNSI